MINSINIKKYRKLTDISIDLSARMNIISGTNGTCKSSVLYLVSNSFQGVKTSCPWLHDMKVIKNINALNTGVNLKIERLTRGDDVYNDPAPNEKGTLFTCNYEDGVSLSFRRHNTKENEKNRYALKPTYKRESGERLPQLPIIYLGLSRLCAFGEYNSEVNALSSKMPSEYLKILDEEYAKFTHMNVVGQSIQELGEIKKRAKFGTDREGVDSNTISAGEDNLFIILTALVSLRYYFENIDSSRMTESILLIDEVDATLHQAYQKKLVDLFVQYSEKYKIKMIFTSHSLSFLRYAMKANSNVLYFLDDINSVSIMEDVSIEKIEMFLNNQTKEEMFKFTPIPVFTEDEQARDFLKIILSHFSSTKEEFAGNERFFHLVEASISCTALKSLFNDDELINQSLQSICILDGDQNQDLNKNIIVLPGKNSPEEVLFQYAEEQFEKDGGIWKDSVMNDSGYTKLYYQEHIQPQIREIAEKIEERKNEGETTRGMRREMNKKVYESYDRFFRRLTYYWIDDHKRDVEFFYRGLNAMFCKVCRFNRINPSEWRLPTEKTESEKDISANSSNNAKSRMSE